MTDTDPGSASPVPGLRRMTAAASLSAIALAVPELMAWILGVHPPASGLLRYIPMAPSTAICFIALGLNELFEPGKKSGKAHVAVSVIAIVLAMAFSWLEFLEYWGPTGLDLEDLLLPDWRSANGIPLARMSPLTGALFVLLSGAVLCRVLRSALHKEPVWLGSLGGALGSIVGFGGFTILLGYVYGTPFLYGGGIIPVAATTAAAFLFMCIAVLARLEPRDIPNRYFGKSPIHRRLVQAFVPLVFFAMVLQAIISRSSPRVLAMNEALLSALLAASMAILAVIATSRTAAAVGNAIDQAEQALRESEKRFRMLIQTAGSVIICLDTDFRIVEFNREAERLFGKKREHVLGRNYVELFVPDRMRKTAVEYIQTVLSADRTEGFENLVTNVRGEKRALIWNVTRLVGHEGQATGILAVGLDVRERKKAEKALRESEERYRAVFDNAALGIGVVDLGGRIVNANSALLDMLGYTLAELQQLTVFDITHPEDLDASQKSHEALGRRELPSFRVEKRYVKKDGTTFWVDLSVSTIHDSEGRYVGNVGVISDVTDRKRAEDAQRLLVTAIEQSIESVMITDRAGAIQYVNPAFERISGYDREQVVGHKPRFLKSDQHDKAFYRELVASLRSGKPWKGRMVSRRKDGAPFHEDVTISPVRNASGQITNFVDLGHDVTQQVQLERQLFQAQKMEAIGTLAGGIAHDFNNLLQVILGYSDLITADMNENETNYQDLRTIRQAAARGADLVKQILTFSRRVETNLRPVNLNQSVTQAEKLLARTIPKMIHIQLILADDLKTINADPGQIEQVLLNLAVNAQHAMPTGGTLVIETENVTLDDDYGSAHLGVAPGRYVMLTVSDTGHGMEKSLTEHIFEPFFTTKDLGEGTGLGLAMVFGIVKGHGGHIECYSEPGHGTTFRIYVPSIELRETPEVSVAPAMHDTGTETILLVDDEALILDLGKRILSKAGYTVLIAGHAKEALEIYQGRRGEISLVILDLIMPGMGGAQCLDELLKLDPNARVLIASGYSPERVTQETSGSAAGFIGKPYRVKEMLQRVREVLDAEG